MPDTAVDPSRTFTDVLTANEEYVEHFALGHMDGIAGIAARGLGIVTCMDSRIEPLAMLGIGPGDAKILRNAGARVTDSVLVDMTLASHLLEVSRIMVIAHTRCRMSSASQDEVVAQIQTSTGLDTRSLDFGLVADQRDTLHRDVQRLRSWPFLARGVTVGGFLYDVTTGRLEQVV
ncbi:MAG TPA: carbonic anhydrase [Mycobacteriales bacterium]|nr:carbonic anhydrase [Mycobacteriales bacterium]